MRKFILLTFLMYSAISFSQQSKSETCDCSELTMQGKDGRSAFKENFVYTGTCITTNPEGVVIKEQAFINGQLEGELKEYFPAGNIKEITTYTKNMKHGKYVLYNQSGKILIEGSYSNQQKEGVWNFYDKASGKLIKSTTYRYGKENLPGTK
ncbi:toxin-antitoxin system YwqK family antitoxin [Robertkochia solimangrovi]|uniref:toxin-antitoxin system YwqK family antitoxin n=1 Tax=Robertkochia solimangrovi TaxID=2213046 RepID=UPI00117E217E|nr:hypothetical protein [Robertkochia solimangrovi]TRZ43978.1 hypothetical protein DMZ48_08475 [Robertkochia solimangrovi]